jgi:hypothetical protein
VFLISGATGAGTRELCLAVMELLEAVATQREPQVRGNLELPKPVRRRTVKKAAGGKKRKVRRPRK